MDKGKLLEKGRGSERKIFIKEEEGIEEEIHPVSNERIE
jgi:hypothetical protein